ncbi:hypothetical protein [Pseudolactococcus reticulitermitis]|uniref:Uncharacterized protein n=1 Tax=Pseudolactococcus reticulitermitis TaxID=2025039 RepID=A0A224WYW3_9LACT|nr:hypothetical protein [Lactococcus reticulitermitis]GAX47277.1 hypothetical protein RsY01_876 [Lactococcus reticulitermitis]
MNDQILIQSIISIFTVFASGFFSFLLTLYKIRSENKTKSNEFEIKNRELEQRLTELEKSQRHEIDKLTAEYELLKSSKSDDMQNEMLGKFFSGELDFSRLAKSIDGLSQLNNKVKNLK